MSNFQAYFKEQDLTGFGEFETILVLIPSDQLKAGFACSDDFDDIIDDLSDAVQPEMYFDVIYHETNESGSWEKIIVEYPNGDIEGAYQRVPELDNFDNEKVWDTDEYLIECQGYEFHVPDTKIGAEKKYVLIEK